ncbi:MAG TPA: RecX family transcriptional regulator [Anaerolineae bacterium]|nr:RecX family transcriptional regulator [Anaerolineae bacterium]HXV98646.1 RecX family transcriptional regulator [Anaerolineae bacterium]
MAGTITALNIQKKNKERVNVFIDDQFALAVTALVAVTLRKGQYLSDADIERLKDGDELDKAYNDAIRFLGYRPRSQSEIERYLHDKAYAAEVINHIVERLRNDQYLDDEAFARFWLENRERFRPRGRQALRFELKQKGLDHEVIETALADLDEDESAWLAVENKLYRWKNLEEQPFKQKVMGFLSRRGFSYETASSIANRAWASLASPE